MRALEDVSLEMDAGCVCILGQNGSGKTTLMKHLNGLLKPSSGRVLVRGEDTRDHRVAHLARHVALAFQNPDDQLFRSSVEREVRFGAENMGFPPEEAEKLVERALDLLQLRDVRHRKPYDLGLSWRKRVAIASVLTMASPVVVLDEPTGGQDAEGIQLLGALVEHLVGRGSWSWWSPTTWSSPPSTPTAPSPCTRGGCCSMAGPERCSRRRRCSPAPTSTRRQRC